MGVCEFKFLASAVHTKIRTCGGRTAILKYYHSSSPEEVTNVSPFHACISVYLYQLYCRNTTIQLTERMR